MKKYFYAFVMILLSSEILWGASLYKVQTSILNVRSGPSTMYRTIGSVKYGQQYRAITQQGSWVKIWYNENTGWVYGKYLSAVQSGQTLEILAYYLNVRTGPGTGYYWVGRTKRPAEYAVIGSSGNWKKIWYGGSARWVYGGSGYAILRSISAPAPTPPVSPPVVSPSPNALSSFNQIRRGGVLQRGNKGPLVKELQKRLHNLGFYLTRDGIFGRGTERKLQSFQKACGVQTTGRFGPTTLKALEWAENLVASHSQSTGIAYSRGSRLGTIKLIYIDGKPVEIRTALAYSRMVSTASQSGITIRVVSGFRTYAKQKQLYQLYVNGRGNLAAYPGYSNHQNGLALDLNTSSSGVLSWLNRNGRNYGFLRTVPSEKWHWEYRP